MVDRDPESIPPVEKYERQDGSNLFGGKERESLINEIVNEIRKDSVKQDVLTKLKKAKWPERISKFFQHPAVLLIIGFAITGWIGGWLANRWQAQEWNRQQIIQSQEWERQQQRQFDIHGIDLKYGIVDEITKSIGERNAAAAGIIVPLLGEYNNRQLIKEEEDPIKNWQKADHDWRVNVQVLKLKLAAHINNQQASQIFDGIIKKERDIGAKVNTLKNNLKRYNQEESDDAAQDILNKINEIGPDMKQLIAIIADETQSEIKGNKP